MLLPQLNHTTLLHFLHRLKVLDKTKEHMEPFHNMIKILDTHQHNHKEVIQDHRLIHNLKAMLVRLIQQIRDMIRTKVIILKVTHHNNLKAMVVSNQDMIITKFTTTIKDIIKIKVTIIKIKVTIIKTKIIIIKAFEKKSLKK